MFNLSEFHFFGSISYEIHILEQLELKLEKKMGFRNVQEKLENIFCQLEIACKWLQTGIGGKHMRISVLSYCFQKFPDNNRLPS